MKTKYKILTIVVCVSVLFSLVCVSASAYGFSENRTDMPSLTNRDLIRFNDPVVTSFGDLGSHTFNLGFERWAKRDYYGNGNVSVANYRTNTVEHIDYLFGLTYNSESAFSIGNLKYSSVSISNVLNQLNGIDVYCKQYLVHSIQDGGLYDFITLPISSTNISSASIEYETFVDGSFVHNIDAVEYFDIDGSVHIDLNPYSISTDEDMILYNLELRVNFVSPVSLDYIQIVSPYCSVEYYNNFLEENLIYNITSYNPAPTYAEIWDLFADAVEAFFAVKLFGTISLGSVILVVVGVFLFRLVLKVFAGD